MRQLLLAIRVCGPVASVLVPPGSRLAARAHTRHEAVWWLPLQNLPASTPGTGREVYKSEQREGAGLAHPLTLLLGADRPSAPDTRTMITVVLVSSSWGD